MPSAPVVASALLAARALRLKYKAANTGHVNNTEIAFYFRVRLAQQSLHEPMGVFMLAGLYWWCGNTSACQHLFVRSDIFVSVKVFHWQNVGCGLARSTKRATVYFIRGGSFFLFFDYIVNAHDM